MDFNSQYLHLGISNKTDGPMKNSMANRLLFLKNKKLGQYPIISAALVHKNRVAIIDAASQSRVITDCDALITDQKDCLLTITVADCLPLYFYDKNKKVVALAHAGWRGVISGISQEVVKVFIDRYYSDPRDLEIFIGPHIQTCHFEVKDDVASEFAQEDLIMKEEKIYINLAAVVRNQLMAVGVSADNIVLSSECTYCLNDKYFSFRRDHPKILETMLAYVGLK